MKALNYLFDIANGKLRGYNTPEMCHPRFNNWKRGIREAQLEGSCLKAICQSNHSSGPYLSTANLHVKNEALTLRLRSVDEEWLYNNAESKAKDRGHEFDPALFDAETELREWKAYASSEKK